MKTIEQKVFDILVEFAQTFQHGKFDAIDKLASGEFNLLAEAMTWKVMECFPKSSSASPKTATDPFDLYETLYWCFVAGQAKRKAQGKEREGIVKDALDRLYKKLEGKKVVIQILPDDKN